MNGKQRRQLIKSVKEVIAKELSLLNKLKVGTDDYNEQLNHIKELEQIIANINSNKKQFKIEKEWIPVIGSLASILLIMSYERANIIATKALGFVKKA